MMWRHVLVFLSSLIAASVMAMATDSGKYLASLPEGPVVVERGNNYWSVNYCPDNTCDLIQVSTSLKEDEVRSLALGFFIYFSGYIYLNQWQEEARRNESMQMELRLLSTPRCHFRDGKQLVKCRFRELASKGKLKVFFVRFDEGKRSAKQLRLSDVLQ